MQGTTSTNLDRYQKMDKLGEGTYGVVYKAKDKITGEVSLATNVLSTSLRLSHLRRLDSRKKTMEFLALLLGRSLFLRVWNTPTSLSKFTDHANLYRLKEVLYSEDKLYLVFEYCEFDLKKYMRHIGGPLPPQDVKKFTY